MDLLIMEDLFHKQDISRTFDLKGIGKSPSKRRLRGHKLTACRGKKSAQTSCTSLDGGRDQDCQPRDTVRCRLARGNGEVAYPASSSSAILRVYARDPANGPDAKRILNEAIAADTKFLSAQSVMDYSLLLGLDKGKNELVVGIVDSIGSYNLWKTIESRGKLALTRGGEVTVVSPRCNVL